MGGWSTLGPADDELGKDRFALNPEEAEVISLDVGGNEDPPYQLHDPRCSGDVWGVCNVRSVDISYQTRP